MEGAVEEGYRWEGNVFHPGVSQREMERRLKGGKTLNELIVY